MILLGVVLSLSFVLPVWGAAQGNRAFEGKWKLIPKKSSEISLYRNLSLEIHQNGPKVTLIEKWGTRRFFADTLVLKTGGKLNKIKIKNRVFPTNVFMGLRMAVGKIRKIRAFWEKDGKSLRLEMTYPLLSSQGGTEVTATHILALTSDAHVMTYTVSRSTRDAAPPIIYVLKKEGYREAFMMRLAGNWEVKGDLPKQAFLISLQGLANRTAPRLYFIYPKDWPVTFTPLIYNFLQDHMNFTFKQLKTPEQALQALKKYVDGYVVWDQNVRTSLIVAFTVAGLKNAVVVNENKSGGFQREVYRANGLPNLQMGLPSLLETVQQRPGALDGRRRGKNYETGHGGLGNLAKNLLYRFVDPKNRHVGIWAGGQNLERNAPAFNGYGLAFVRQRFGKRICHAGFQPRFCGGRIEYNPQSELFAHDSAHPGLSVQKSQECCTW